MRLLILSAALLTTPIAHADEWLTPGPHHVPPAVTALRTEAEANPNLRIFIIAGLGNGSSRFVNTRHNYGRQLLERMTQNLAATTEQDQFKIHYQAGQAISDEELNILSFRSAESTNFVFDDGTTLIEDTEYRTRLGDYRSARGEIFVRRESNGILDAVYLYLIPFHDINESGVFIQSVLHELNEHEVFVPVERLYVAMDETDLPFGKMKLNPRSNIGHGGTQSLVRHLPPEMKTFQRVRLGIGQPLEGKFIDHVLGEWTADEWAQLSGRLFKESAQTLNKHCADVFKRLTIDSIDAQ